MTGVYSNTKSGSGTNSAHFLNVYKHFACMYVCVLPVWIVPKEIWRECQITWDWSYGCEVTSRYREEPQVFLSAESSLQPLNMKPRLTLNSWSSCLSFFFFWDYNIITRFFLYLSSLQSSHVPLPHSSSNSWSLYSLLLHAYIYAYKHIYS